MNHFFIGSAILLLGCLLSGVHKHSRIAIHTFAIMIFTVLFMGIAGCSNHHETEWQAEQDEMQEQETEKQATEVSKGDQEAAADKKVVGHLDEMNVHFIDVGQADATFIEFSDDGNRYHIVIDTGDLSSRSMVRYLHQQNVETIDLLVGSHTHADHIGQMDDVMDTFDVDEVWMTGGTASSQVFERAIDAIESSDAAYDEPRVGDEFEMGPLQIDVLSPHTLSGDLNDDSIVMRLEYGNASFLFEGDAEANAEGLMVRSGEKLKSDVLKVGHHGSNTSSTPAFIEAVDPDIAVISVAKNSRYNHPNQEVVDRLKSRDLALYATSSHGTITVTTNGEKYSIQTKDDGNITPGSVGGVENGNRSESAKEPETEVEEHPVSSKDCIHINHANASELQEIIHIGPVRAEKVIEARPFNSVSDLTSVNGIGSSRMKDINAQGIACMN